MLIFYNIEFKHTHNLIYLLELLSDKVKISEDDYDKAITLNSFRVQIRYPDTIVNLTEDELKNAIEIVVYFRDLTINLIKF